MLSIRKKGGRRRRPLVLQVEERKQKPLRSAWTEWVQAGGKGGGIDKPNSRIQSLNPPPGAQRPVLCVLGRTDAEERRTCPGLSKVADERSQWQRCVLIAWTPRVSSSWERLVSLLTADFDAAASRIARPCRGPRVLSACPFTSESHRSTCWHASLVIDAASV